MDIFNWEFYVEFNNDIIDIYGNSEKSALNHYNEYGKMENRIINQTMLYNIYPLLKFFDHEYYLEQNSDLIIINSKFRLIKHYLIQGYKENRKIHFFSPIFLCFNFNKKLLDWSKILKKPLVSIIVPVYNRSNIICECINSLLNQTYPNIEIIIINDSSTDSTLNELNIYKSNNKIKILDNLQNYGCYTSINFGLSISSGEYITIHGSDDVSLPNRIEELIYTMSTNNLLMCGNYILRSHFKTFKNINLSDTTDIFNSIIQFKMNNTIHNNECCNPLISLGTLIYHRSVFDIIGEYKNIKKGADMVFFEEFLFYYEKIKFYKNDCSHRYLTKVLSGNHFKIIDDILYISSEIDNNNLTSQKSDFNINSYRDKIYSNNNIN
jgi:glycosyltransferase involved in cell wall biosynthesis